MNVQIEIIQTPVYTSPNGFKVVYDHNGKRNVFDNDGLPMSVIGKSNPHLQEIYDLMKFAENHRANKVQDTTEPRLITNYKDLVVGKLYATSLGKDNTILKFIKIEEVVDSVLFKHVSGPMIYGKLPDGTIPFPWHQNFYELNTAHNDDTHN